MAKNILHVVNIYFVLPYFFGGQFKYFAEKGFGMNVVCSKSEYLADYAAKMGFDYIETPINRSFTISEDIKSIRAVCKFIRKKKIDIVVGHTPKGALIAMIAGWLTRVPARIYFRHGLVFETSKGLKRFLLKSIDRITSVLATKVVCVSKSVREQSIKNRLAPERKQLVLGNGTCNGVDTVNSFNPEKIDSANVAALRQKYGIAEDDFVIGYSGRLVRDKGIADLVAAFDLLENKEKCKLLLVGMFEERDSLPDSVIERIKTDKSIVYTGFINGGMQNYYALMNVYVLASYREGFATGNLEAQSMGIPVLTTRATGCFDSIVEGRTGLLVSHQPSDIAAKINSIRYDKAIDGAEGRKWVIENFDSRIVWANLEKFYLQQLR